MTHKYEHYSMVIQWSEEDKVYIVTVSELPGCRTHDKTYKKAIRQGQDAIESWIDASLAGKHTVPAPKVLVSQ